MQEQMRSAREFLGGQLGSFGKLKACGVFTQAGDSFQIISEMVQACAADLIVLGAHRCKVLRDVFAGTTFERVTRTACRPVLMANSKAGGHWKKVFIVVYMSETSAQAVRTEHALGLHDGTEVTFVYAYAPIVRPVMIYAGITLDHVTKKAER